MISFLKESRPALVLFVLLIMGIVLTLGSVTLFVKVRSEVLEREALTFDTSISESIYLIRTPLMTNVMMIITNFGGVYIIFLTMAMSAYLFLKGHRPEASLFLFLLAMGIFLNILLKAGTMRPRPTTNALIIETDSSFPSGHAMNSFVFYTTCSYLVFHFTKSREKTIFAFICSGILIGLIGFSRVYLGVHYPTDILAGYAAGMVWFGSVLVSQKAMVFFKLFRSRSR